MQRRDFLKAAAVMPGMAAAAGPLPKRPYRDGIQLSISGFGGVVVMGMDQKDANRIAAEAFDRGVNYFDVAPSYGDGEAEIKLGEALRPFRKQAFLACKTEKRDAEGTRAELERSLQRLHTDYFDLYQFHAVTTMKDVEQIFGPGGAAETFVKARAQGKVRYLGCSAHSEEAALAMLDRFQLDSVLFPINFVCFSQSHFGPRVIARAKEKGAARLALKAMARSSWAPGADRSRHPKAWYEPIEDAELAAKALRFTLSEGVTAAIPPGDEANLRRALDIAARFKPMTGQERADLLASARGIKPLFPVS